MWWIPPNLEIHFSKWPIFSQKGGSDTIGDLGWRGLSFNDFPRDGDDFSQPLRKELEKAIDLLEQDTPYRFRVVTPPPGYGSLWLNQDTFGKLVG